MSRGKKMPRPLRIEFAGAFYHVYSRGNQKQPIFFGEDDLYYFLKVLRDAIERFGIIVHLYCLMKNHYHMTIETPEPNLSEVMHFVNTAYSVYFNKKHERCGHLFQGRYKAILVQADTYARNLTIYTHGNPVRKKIVARPEEYPWSSCQDYYGIRNPFSWLETSIIMGIFGNSRETLRIEHERVLHESNGGEDRQFIKDLRKASSIGILGDDDFIDRIKRTYLAERMEESDPELCELRRLRARPDLSEIANRIGEELGPNNRLVKKCTIFFAHKYAGFKLREIGAYFGIGPGAVSASYRKTKKEITSNHPLSRVINTLRSASSDTGIISEEVKIRKV